MRRIGLMLALIAVLFGAPAGGVPASAQEPEALPLIGSANMHKSVFMLIYDPMMPNGRPLSQYPGWNNPDTVNTRLLSRLNSASAPHVEASIKGRQVIANFPPRKNGSRLTPAQYEQCIRDNTFCEKGWWHPEYGLDITKVLNSETAPSLCAHLAAGAVDEVWLWMMPGSNGLEYYVMPASTCPNLNHPFVVMNYNYQRTVEVALESFGHRAEGILNGDTPIPVPAPMKATFDQFTGGIMWRYSQDYGNCPPTPGPGYPEVDVNNTGAGNAHFPPNAYCHYQYDRDKPVWSTAEDWKNNYPNLTGQKTWINRADWGCVPGANCHEEFLAWWFDHFPKKASHANYTNWWTYVYAMHGPCGSSPSGPACRFDSRTVAADASAPSGTSETITAYGKYWVFDRDSSQLMRFGKLSETAHMPHYNQLSGGPCANGELRCTFNSRAIVDLGGAPYESITANGRYWNFRVSDQAPLSSNGSLLTSVARYASGPCAHAPAGQLCTFDTRAYTTLSGSLYESITAYGRYWNFRVGDQAPLPSNGSLLSSVARYQ